MQLKLKKHDPYDEESISSLDEVHIVLSRLEAVRLSDDLGKLTPQTANESTREFHKRLEEAIKLPKSLTKEKKL